MQAQGNPWKALGVLTAAGALKSAVQLLKRLKLPDRVAVYIEAAHACGFGSNTGNSAAGAPNLPHKPTLLHLPKNTMT